MSLNSIRDDPNVQTHNVEIFLYKNLYLIYKFCDCENYCKILTNDKKMHATVYYRPRNILPTRIFSHNNRLSFI